MTALVLSGARPSGEGQLGSGIGYCCVCRGVCSCCSFTSSCCGSSTSSSSSSSPSSSSSLSSSSSSSSSSLPGQASASSSSSSIFFCCFLSFFFFFVPFAAFLAFLASFFSAFLLAFLAAFFLAFLAAFVSVVSIVNWSFSCICSRRICSCSDLGVGRPTSTVVTAAGVFGVGISGVTSGFPTQLTNFLEELEDVLSSNDATFADVKTGAVPGAVGLHDIVPPALPSVDDVANGSNIVVVM
mmetsp:Transcript_9288/g.13598  ORF Transcript_9288/g.13598 Transcript_9288/m.13598 type:complete len:241 (-) Transcript_9288:91-813(-)